MNGLNGLFKFFDYLLYLIQSTNQHGVHSPFVFNFCEQTLYKKQKNEFEHVAELCRQKMIQSSAKIQFYQGEKHSSLSAFAENRIPLAKYNRLLFRWIQNQKLGNHIIEIGSSMGVLPIYLQRGSSDIIRYFVFDNSSKIINISEFNVSTSTINESIHFSIFQNAKSIIHQLENQWRQNNVGIEQNKIDLLIVNDIKNNVDFWELIDWALPHLATNGSIIMNKKNKSAELQLRWKQLQFHPEITVSIDMFDMGMVFSRKEQQKEDFILRY